MLGSLMIQGFFFLDLRNLTKTEPPGVSPHPPPPACLQILLWQCLVLCGSWVGYISLTVWLSRDAAPVQLDPLQHEVRPRCARCVCCAGPVEVARHRLHVVGCNSNMLTHPTSGAAGPTQSHALPCTHACLCAPLQVPRLVPYGPWDDLDSGEQLVVGGCGVHGGPTTRQADRHR
jgi:hypothetical protein